MGRCLKKYKEDTIKNVTSSPDNKSITKESSSSHKRKFKITAHHYQDFIDEENEIYIWVWNPTPPMHYVYGAGVLLLVIGGTLFPLWPDSLRTGVYYTSVSMAGFIGSVLVTGLLRTIVFGFIWCLTGGKHHFWFLPNLLADVGFFESFQPVMTYEVYDKDGKRVKNRENREEIWRYNVFSLYSPFVDCVKIAVREALQIISHLFGCVFASLSEGVSVFQSVGKSLCKKLYSNWQKLMEMNTLMEML